MFTSRYLCLNQYHQLFPSIPSRNGVSLVCVIHAILIFSYCKLMDNPHPCISKVHLIITNLFFINTPPSPIFLGLVFLFKWLESEFKGMFHDMLTLLKEHVPLSITFIDDSNVSYVHMLSSYLL